MQDPISASVTPLSRRNASSRPRMLGDRRVDQQRNFTPVHGFGDIAADHFSSSMIRLGSKLTFSAALPITDSSTIDQVRVSAHGKAEPEIVGRHDEQARTDAHRSRSSAR